MPAKAGEFDEAYWRKAVKRPDWYIEFLNYAKKVDEQFSSNRQEIDKRRYEYRQFFERALASGEVVLATTGSNLDKQRQPVDTVVIHHTSNKPGYRLGYLNAVHLLNIYAPYFANPTDEREKSLKGQALWSGHFYQGQQVFWGYHWLMRMDPVRNKIREISADSPKANRTSNRMNGSFDRLLSDDQIGWHAGNWQINKRSVAICLDNDYENKDPGDDILQKLAAHIKKYYPAIKAQNIIGHCEAKAGTTCPGSNFIKTWKPKLLQHL